MLFATTNHIERLDPALSRPGRMDVWVNFTNASKWQAEGIFKCFFPCKSATPPDAATEEAEAVAAAAAAATVTEKSATAQRNLPGSKRKAAKHVVPLLDEAEINVLAKRFGDSIPEDEMSVRAPAPPPCADLQLTRAATGREPAGLPAQEQDAPARVRRGGR